MSAKNYPVAGLGGTLYDLLCKNAPYEFFCVDWVGQAVKERKKERKKKLGIMPLCNHCQKKL